MAGACPLRSGTTRDCPSRPDSPNYLTLIHHIYPDIIVSTWDNVRRFGVYVYAAVGSTLLLMFKYGLEGLVCSGTHTAFPP